MFKGGGCTQAEKADCMELTWGLLCEQNKEKVCVSPGRITRRLCKTHMPKPSVVENTRTTAVEPEAASGLLGQPLSHMETLAKSK